MRELSASYPELDLRYELLEILGADALTGGVEIRKVLVETERLNNMHYGHSSALVEHCVLYGRPQVSRHLLEQGAEVCCRA